MDNPYGFPTPVRPPPDPRIAEGLEIISSALVAHMARLPVTETVCEVALPERFQGVISPIEFALRKALKDVSTSYSVATRNDRHGESRIIVIRW